MPAESEEERQRRQIEEKRKEEEDRWRREAAERKKKKQQMNEQLKDLVGDPSSAKKSLSMVSLASSEESSTEMSPRTERRDK